MSEFKNEEREVVSTSQNDFDKFNSFIFSGDKRLFSKLAARAVLFNKVKDVPGDIVECGVFKGSGILTWLKLKYSLSPGAFKKIIGFDMFDENGLISILSGHDKDVMEDLFKKRNFSLSGGYMEQLADTIRAAGFDNSHFELIKGDVSKTSYEYVQKRPGARVSLLYLDMDVDVPTYDALCAFWSRIPKGGIVVFDEYASHQWTESNGADRFAQQHGLRIKTLDFCAPTAFIEKE